ncbi:enoyl-CoA hydratase-related protein [Aerosticca soli]|uniref:Methylglutaconyl-CoA hydratase n=1 Tax=Aerosticca soli TaxID=2010829 RepID=A0A2Z6E657_9GAMM|nr:enoyl-CoA hydratase-related protein [Aerosticca soli]BBD80487.1 methylglutaconyl-CoA hydratase [Aerosticca soli]
MNEVLVADRAGVRELAMNRPQVHNALDEALIDELIVQLEKARYDPEVRALVLTGLGQSFCAGADLGAMQRQVHASEEENLADALRLARLIRSLQFFPKPTVARVNGAAYGGGVGLVACCDIAIGVGTARFGLTEVRLGLVPAMISPYVIAAIGLRQARRLFVTGEIFDAEEARRIGLLHQVVAGEALDGAVEAALAHLAKAGPEAQGEAKRLALAMAELDEAAAERIDRDNAALIARLRVSAEGQEGLGAFLAKRAPRWMA